MLARGAAFTGCLAGLVIATGGLSPANAEERSLVPGRCTFVQQGTGRLSEIIDATSVRLESGEIIRLAGVDVPLHMGDPTAPAPELLEMVGETVLIAPADTAIDRYGRTVAHLHRESDGAWLQGVLLRTGQAIVVPTLGDYECIADLLAFERQGRDARLGIWDGYVVPDADSDAIRDGADRFTLVEGEVVSIGRTESTVYLNFGWDWDRDLTVTFRVTDADMIEAESGSLDALVGAVIRVRGWLSQRDGPWIRVDQGEQIEVLSGDARAAD